MNEYKNITICRAGGTAMLDIEIIPGETVDQLIPIVARDLGLDENGVFEILSPNGSPLKGDLFKQIKEGDNLTLAPLNTGGFRVLS